MNVKKFLIFGFTLKIILAFSTNVFPGLISGTKITTAQGLVLIESLAIDDKITVYDLSDKSFPELAIKNIVPKEVQGFYVIATNKGIIQASGDQLIYEVVGDDYLKADQLNAGDIFLTKDQQECVCMGVEYQEAPAHAFDLTLAEPHTFFSSEMQLLTHNAATAFICATPWLAQALLGAIGFCVGMVCLYNDKPTNMLSTVEQVETKVTNDVERLCAEHYNYTKNRAQWVLPANFKTDCNPSKPKHAPFKGGVTLDTSLCQELNLYPLRFGTLYPIATMTDTGKIACTVWAPRFSHRSRDDQAIFVFTELGKTFYARSNPFIKAYLEAEDNAQLNNLKNHIRPWPREIKSKLFAPTTDIVEK